MESLIIEDVENAVIQEDILDDVKIARFLKARSEVIIITPQNQNISLNSWLSAHQDFVQEVLLECGAVLFRRFKDLNNLENFHQAFSLVCGNPLKYEFRTSPRTEVKENIYTSTDHPASQDIHMHTESSYSSVWPRSIAFFCHLPSQTGGETPIANEQKVLGFLEEDIIEKFKEHHIMYERNFSRGIGLPWQTAFQTDSKKEVEYKLEKDGMEYEWKGNDYLKMRWVQPAFRTHPVSGKQLWFNHMYFGHKSLYDKKVLSIIPEDYLPFLTKYGNGTEIESNVITKLKEGYERYKSVFKWRKGDLLMLENMVYSHGRNPYTGDRKILVAMANRMKG